MKKDEKNWHISILASLFTVLVLIGIELFVIGLNKFINIKEFYSKALTAILLLVIIWLIAGYYKIKFVKK